MITAVRILPSRPNVQQYKKQAKELLEAWKSGDSDARQRITTFHPRLSKLPQKKAQIESSRPTALVLADAHLVLAREHGFESWPKFSGHIEALNRTGSMVPAFERATDAIVAGDVAGLERLLSENPQLIRARSTRLHRATLLHYVGANGVEDFRQKTARNAVDILQVLLEAGAEVDARADMYSQDTTLGLVATSVHPVRSGVQQALMETLLAAGAAIDADRHIVNACLANGRPQAAEFLAQRGAPLDLEAAAGVGRLDLIRDFFESDGGLKAGATQKQMQAGLNWACEYGHASVVDFLLESGAHLGVPDSHGQTALHWAVIGGQLGIVEILLPRKPPLEAKNVYGGTVLGQAAWSAVHDEVGTNYVPIIEALLAAGADVSAVALPTGNRRIDEIIRRRP